LRRVFAVIKGGRDTSAPRSGSPDGLQEGRLNHLEEIEALNGKAEKLLVEVYGAEKAGNRKKELQLTRELLDTRLELARKMSDERVHDEVGGHLVAAAEAAYRCHEISEEPEKTLFFDRMKEVATQYFRSQVRRRNSELASSIVRRYGLTYDEMSRIRNAEESAMEARELAFPRRGATDE